MTHDKEIKREAGKDSYLGSIEKDKRKCETETC